MTNQTNPTQLAEPVAWIENHKCGQNLSWDEINHPYAKATPLFTHPSPFTAELKAELLEALTIGEKWVRTDYENYCGSETIEQSIYKSLNKIRAAIALLEKDKP